MQVRFPHLNSVSLQPEISNKLLVKKGVRKKILYSEGMATISKQENSTDSHFSLLII
jgi:hypothetical protein